MTIKNLSCNTVIIGAGSAGVAAFQEYLKYDDNFIVVETGPLGTTLQRSGDIPANTLMSAALQVNSLSTLYKYGINLQGSHSFDTTQVMNSLRAIRAKGTNEVLSYLYRLEESKRIIGRARFINQNEIIVDDHIHIDFKCAIIATGAVPLVPYELAIKGNVLTLPDIYELDDVPKSLAVFGCQNQGLVVGQALSYLGTKVIVFADENIWQITDNIVLNTARDVFQKNFNLEVNAKITEIDPDEKGFGIYYLDCNDYENYIHVEHILSSSASIAKTDGLNLKALNISINNNGVIEVNNRTLQSSVGNIFAIGDVANAFHSTSKAINDAKVAAYNASHYPYVKSKNINEIRLNILNSDPPLAVVGLSFNQMKERARYGKPFIASEGRMSDGIYRARHKDGGIIRLYTDEDTTLVLGAEICGYGADHIAQFLAQAIVSQKTIFDLENFVFYKPSYEEVIAKAVASTIKALKRKSNNIYGK